MIKSLYKNFCLPPIINGKYYTNPEYALQKTKNSSFNTLKRNRRPDENKKKRREKLLLWCHLYVHRERNDYLFFAFTF